MRLWLAVVMLLTGCRQLLGIDSPAVGDGGVDDAAADALAVDSPGPDAALTCLGRNGFEVCFIAPTSNRLVPAALLNTDSSGECATPGSAQWSSTNAPSACFIVAKAITVSTVSVVGSRSLVFVATESITVTNAIDAASHVTSNIGPGAPWGLCSAFAATPGSSVNGAGGGAGGSMNQLAGSGGAGSNGAGQGGMANAQSAVPTVLHAGCHGQAGGTGSSIGGAGIAGHGGGAIYLVAGSSIALDGAVINVSGGGGGTSSLQGGGGGGGSGGVIVLDAPAITANTSRLLSNGGGGGGGSTSTAPSGNGGDPDANGGIGTGGAGGDDGTGPIGGAGATGGAGPFPQTGIMGSNGGAGGGGGGATGFILVARSLSGAYTSPAVTILP